MQTALPDQPAGQTGALAPLRLLIGFLQAVALSGLVVIHHDDLWPGKSSFLFSALLMASLFLPVLWLSGLGWLSASQMRRWSCGALSLILVFAAIDVADGAGTVTPQDETAFFIQTRFGELLLGAGLILYIGHALVLAGARERRWIASRAGCLSCAWKFGVQLMLSLVTVAALSIPLRVVGAMWVGPCEVWPVVLACGVGFAGAMHLTDSARSGRRAALPA
jgi:hypothetical protein